MDSVKHFHSLSQQIGHPWDNMKACGFVNLGDIIGNYLRNELSLSTNEIFF